MASRSSKLKKKHPGDFVPLGLTCSEDNCTKKMKYYSSYLRLVSLLNRPKLICKLQTHAKGAQEVSTGSNEYCPGSQRRKSWQVSGEEEMPSEGLQSQVQHKEESLWPSSQAWMVFCWHSGGCLQKGSSSILAVHERIWKWGLISCLG